MFVLSVKLHLLRIKADLFQLLCHHTQPTRKYGLHPLALYHRQAVQLRICSVFKSLA